MECWNTSGCSAEVTEKVIFTPKNHSSKMWRDGATRVSRDSCSTSSLSEKTWESRKELASQTTSLHFFLCFSLSRTQINLKWLFVTCFRFAGILTTFLQYWEFWNCLHYHLVFFTDLDHSLKMCLLRVLRHRRGRRLKMWRRRRRKSENTNVTTKIHKFKQNHVGYGAFFLPWL